MKQCKMYRIFIQIKYTKKIKAKVDKPPTDTVDGLTEETTAIPVLT